MAYQSFHLAVKPASECFRRNSLVYSSWWFWYEEHRTVIYIRKLTFQNSRRCLTGKDLFITSFRIFLCAHGGSLPSVSYVFVIITQPATPSSEETAQVSSFFRFFSLKLKLKIRSLSEIDFRDSIMSGFNC